MAEPPFSLEAEQLVIGGLFISPGSFDEVAALVSAEDFHDARNRDAWEAMAELNTKKFPIDFLTVSERLEDAGKLGGDRFAYYGSLYRDSLSAANLLAYASLVRSKATQRRLCGLGITLQQKSLTEPPEAVLEWFTHAIRSVDTAKNTEVRKIRDFIPAFVDDVDAACEGRPVSNPALATGLTDLDALLNGGPRPGDLFVVVGRPSMGKTTLGLQIASRISRVYNTAALIFSLEMAGEKIAGREIAARGEIPLHILRSGQMTEDQWGRFTNATVELSEAKIWIDDTPGLSLQALLTRARRMKREHGLGVIVVDHIGLIGSDRSGMRGDVNRVQEVSNIARELKNLAKELKCPVIALSQLSRGLEQRQDRRPILADLRESGEIEQSADIVAFVYRDEIYYPDSPDKGCAELIVAKHRDGRIGTTAAAFFGERFTFADLAGGLPSATMPKTMPSRRTGLTFDD